MHDAALIVDLHCDLLLTSWFLRWDWTRAHRPNPLPGAPLMGHCDLPRLRAGNVGCLALGVVTSPLWAGPGAVRRDLDQMHAEVARADGRLAVCGTAQEIRRARADGRIACFAGLEGAHPLRGRLDDLPDLRARGLRYVGLAHFTANAACRPMVGLGARRDAPLTDHGRDLVDALDAQRIVIDVAHLNRGGLLETCARARGPVICSHTACNGVYLSPRGLDDDLVRAVADTGGVVGVIFVSMFIGRGGVATVADHLDHLRRLVGVQHAALGTDWEGWATYPSELDSADKLPLLTAELLRRGWRADEIHAVYGENFLRVLGDVCG